MRGVLAVASLAGLGLGLLAAEEQANPRLEGTWKIVRGQDEGKKIPKKKIESDVVIIKKDVIRVTDRDRNQTWVMRFRLDPSHKPGWITMTMLEGQDRGKTAEGIYDLQGDTLRLTYALPGHARPQTFATRSNDHELSFVMKRAKR